MVLVAERRVLLGHGRPALQDEAQLDRHRLLAPERAVVVEYGNAVLGRDLLRRALDEGDDRLARGRVVPGGEARHQSRAPLAASVILSSA
jgi:hypothetical protein